LVRSFLDRHEMFDIRFKNIGIPVEVYPLGKVEKIKKMYGLDAQGLANKIRNFYKSINKKKS